MAETPACTARSHGTNHAFRHRGCTCPGIAQTAYLYNKRQKAGMIPPRVIDSRGARRRVQAMALQGHTFLEISAASGCEPRTIARLFKSNAVTVQVAAAVKAIEWMVWTPAAPGRNATYARRAAERNGYWPLDAWFDPDTDPEPSTVDEVTVMHAVAGYLRWDQLDEQEQHQVVAELSGRGWSDVRIAEHLRTNHSRVARARNRIGIPAVPALGRRTA